jgi:antitoxin component of MazEF toxin-antitoxin module
MVHVVRLHRNGHSVAFIIPRAMVRALAWNRGDQVAVHIQAGQLVVRRLDVEELVHPLRPLSKDAGAPARKR